MPRPATGQVVETNTTRGQTFALRFRAYGARRFVTLPAGTSRREAEMELQNVMADVRRGSWRPAGPAPVVELPERQGFHEFASAWLARRQPELRPATYSAYRNELVHHLLPFFAGHELAQITVAEVDRYREHKLREGVIGGTYINATITRLGAILDVADERGLIDRNPVRVNPRNRKLRVSKARRAYLDRPDQIRRLLDAAEALDVLAGDRRGRDTCLRQPLIATLVFGGLRISEALALRWRDVDLAGGRIRVEAAPDDDETPEQNMRRRAAKTDAGVRWVPLVPALRDELLARKMAAASPSPDGYVFSTRTGRRLSRDNTRTRVLARAHELADLVLLHDDRAPLPERLTQHSLRHTYISLRVAIGDDPAAISRDAGHADMGVTFRIYTHVMALQDGDRERLRGLVSGSDWAETGSESPIEAPTA